MRYNEVAWPVAQLTEILLRVVTSCRYLVVCFLPQLQQHSSHSVCMTTASETQQVLKKMRVEILSQIMLSQC